MSLFPLRIRWTDPVGLGTADAAGVCRCDDECDYAVKDGANYPHTPHNEWFCTELAETIGIPGPLHKAIELADGTLVFGSRWEGGVPKESWHQMVASGTIQFDDVKATLARTFAYDNFIYNEDRHINNYLIRSQKNGHALLAFDYSRAWFFHGFPPRPLPFNPGQNTMSASRWIAAKFGPYLTVSSTNETLDRLAAVTDAYVAGIIGSHPQSWIAQSEIDQILTWWSSPARTDRVNDIRKGIKDGSYL